jgi:hypothetical protein
VIFFFLQYGTKEVFWNGGITLYIVLLYFGIDPVGINTETGFNDVEKNTILNQSDLKRVTVIIYYIYINASI